jgi:Fis family transcriptional regulator
LVIGEVEKPLIEETIKYCKGNQSKAAELLGISRGTLRKKIKQYGI